MGRLLIVSNRLPVSIDRRKDGISFTPSVGGLATGLASFYKTFDSAWIGWADAPERTGSAQRAEIARRLKDEYSTYAVFLSDADVRLYYHGFANKTIWPTFHQFTQYAVFDQSTWQAYVRVNRRFADAIVATATPADTIWIHDYHLMLVPGMVRERMPEATIGFFLHIPFPTFEVFRMLPWRREILTGILGADLVGFHTYDYVRHFLDSTMRLTGFEHLFGQITTADRVVKVDTFPMGIDFCRFVEAAHSAEVQGETIRIRRKSGDRKIILSVDRLDYTKGIVQRLEAFDLFLRRHPEQRERVDLILVAVPSRTRVEHYRELKQRVDELIGGINGEHSTMDWTPVRYMYRSLPFKDLVALYVAADVAMVTPMRDGMNLIAKEFVAAKSGDKGVLILSEMAGAAMEMGEALVVNPNNREELADAIEEALEMPEEEQSERLAFMQRRLEDYDVERWATDFTDQLTAVKRVQRHLNARKLTSRAREFLVSDYRQTARRLLLLDYDGTLMPFSARIEKLPPDAELLSLLQALCADERNEVVIVSGRDRRRLERWLGDLDLGLIAEHGAWTRERGGEWNMTEPLDDAWKAEIRPILDLYVARTPGSFVEEKDFSLAWHYRRTDPALAQMRSRELQDSLTHLTANQSLGVLAGNKVIEVKSSSIDKGRASLRWLDRGSWDFVLALGDDRTDEDVFAVVPDWATSIKIGISPSRAKFSMESVSEVRNLLKELVSADA
ncbi:MAG TPA: bifunctional alpha,alpha-trehalose-phosphate synthase (UDP-forming)/trehalose-phosphatase [Coriobacteriia bacterium]